jgi:hypothetical protein
MRRALVKLLLANFVFARPGVAPVEAEDKESYQAENPGLSNSHSGISRFKRSDYVPSCQEAR